MGNFRLFTFTGKISFVLLVLLMMKTPSYAQATFNPVKDHIVDPLLKEFPRLELRGFITNESDMLLHDNFNNGFPIDFNGDSPAFSRIQWVGELRYKYHFTDKITLKGQLDFLYDSTFDWQSDQDHRARRELQYFRTFKRWFREAYFDIELGRFKFLLGKQQRVWGKVDFLRTLDQLGAEDFREIYDKGPNEFTRQPTWMVVVNYFRGPLIFEVVWMPDFERNIYGPRGWLQSPETMFPQAFSALEIQKADRPNLSFKDHDWAIRVRFDQWNWGFDFAYFYMHGKNPTFFVRGMNPSTDRFIVEPEHARLHRLGMAAEKTFDFGENNQWLFRVESLYTMNQYETVANGYNPTAVRAGTDGVKRKGNLLTTWSIESYLKALGYVDWLFYFQHISFVQFGFGSDQVGSRVRALGPADRFYQIFLWSLSKDFYNERLFINLSVLADSQGGTLLPNSVTWKWNDYFKTTAGFNVYSGQRDDPLGMMDKVGDEVYWKIEYSF